MHEIKLPEAVTISNCDELLNKVIEAKSSNEKIQIDLSAVETIDTAGIQFFYSMFNDVDHVVHVGITDVVKESFVELGLSLV